MATINLDRSAQVPHLSRTVGAAPASVRPSIGTGPTGPPGPTGPSGGPVPSGGTYDGQTVQKSGTSAVYGNPVWPYIDYRAYGIVPDNSTTAVQTANTSGINQMMTDYAGVGAVFLLPSGITYINGPLDAYGYLTADLSANLTIRGTSGGTQSRIHQTDNTKDVFKLATSSGNLRGLLFDDFEVWFGKRQFNMSRCAYNQWRNVKQRQAIEYGVYADLGSSYNTFNQHWIYECPTGDAVYANGSADLTFVNSVFGEMGGAIRSSATLRLIGCRMLGTEDRLNPTGVNGYGSAAITCDGSGQIQIVGGRYEVNKNFLSLNNNKQVSIVGASISVPDTYNLFIQQLAPTNGTRMVGCTVDFAGSGSFLSCPTATVPSKWIVEGNTFTYPAASTVTMDDKLAKAANRNHWADNAIVRI